MFISFFSQSQPKVFSAGLDIMEMYGKSPERCGVFWKAVQEMWLKLYSSNMVTVAAINVRINPTCLSHFACLSNTWSKCPACFSSPQGSSPAGGCLMSLTCDYRIMADNPRYSIGLNETQLGIVAPFWSGMIHLQLTAVMVLFIMIAFVVRMSQTAAILAQWHVITCDRPCFCLQV